MRRPAQLVAVGTTSLLWVLALWVAVPRLGDEDGTTHTWVDGGGLLGVSLATHVDDLAAMLLLLAATVALLVQVYSTAYLRGDPRYRSYACLVVLFELAMITVVVADDLFVLLVGWEVMGICSYLLIGHHWELPAAREGAVKAFVMTRLGDLGLLIGIFVLGGTFGTFSISTILDRIGRGAEPGQLTAAGLLLLCAVVGKSAQFPLHTWLPDAMPGPTPISALIHAATMVAAGVYLVARLYPVFAASAVTMTALAVIACVSMLLAALFALAQSDLKRVLAWSTVSQLAYMFAALAVGGSDAGIAHLLSHGSFKALLFLAAGCVAHAVGSTTLTSMGGLRTAMPVTFVTATIGFAALAGVVPTSGFLTKDAVLSSAVHATQHPAPVAAATAWLVLLVGLLTAVVTVVYSTRTWLLVFFGTREPRAQMHESPVAMTGPLVALAVATLALGATQSWHPALGVLTTLIAVGGVAGTVAYWRRGRDPAELLGASRDLFARELGVDGAYDGLAAGVGRTGDFTVAADTDVIDAYPRGTAVVAVTGSRLLDRLQTGNVQTYAVVFGAGALLVVLAVVAW